MVDEYKLLLYTYFSDKRPHIGPWCGTYTSLTIADLGRKNLYGCRNFKNMISNPDEKIKHNRWPSA